MVYFIFIIFAVLICCFSIVIKEPKENHTKEKIREIEEITLKYESEIARIKQEKSEKPTLEEEFEILDEIKKKLTIN